MTDEVLEALEVLSLIDRLVDKSLLVAEASGTATRSRLLETIRDYGLERLEEAGEVTTFALHHAEHFAEVSERGGRGLRGPDEALWDRVVEVEVENLRAALRWAIATGEADLAVRLVAGLACSGTRMGMPFGTAAAAAAYLEGAVDHPLRPLCLASAAWSACTRGDFEEAVAFSDQALDAGPIGGDKEALRVRSEALTVALSVRRIRDGTDQAVAALFEEDVAVATELGDHYYLAHALFHASEVRAFEQALTVARTTANPSLLAYALALLALRITAEQPARAKSLADEAILCADAVGNEQAGALARQALTAAVSRVGGDQLAAAGRRWNRSSTSWRQASGSTVSFSCRLWRSASKPWVTTSPPVSSPSGSSTKGLTSAGQPSPASLGGTSPISLLAIDGHRLA